MNFFTKSRLICWLLLCCIAGMLFVSYLFHPKVKRVLLYFPKDGGTTGIEERYLPEVYEQECALAVINELLLGPADHTLLRFADPELRPRSCFVRNNVFYLDLPNQILTPKAKTADFYTVYMLLQKNIAVNCKNIEFIYMYIDGVPAYAGNSDKSIHAIL